MAKERPAILTIITSKAEGVFLWVKYALYSLRQGIVAFDSAAELRQRLEELPKGMEELFEDMWQRQENSNRQHRDEAAIYLKCGKLLPISLFGLLVATNDDIQRHYLSTARPLPDAKLNEACATMKKKLMIRTAGLLTCDRRPREGQDLFETAKGQDQKGLRGFQANPQCTSLRRFDRNSSHAATSQTVVYLHRTVHDFLWGTPFGSRIVARPAAQKQDIGLLGLHARLASIVEDFVYLRLSMVHEICDHVRHTVEDSYLGMRQIQDTLSRLVENRTLPRKTLSWYYELQKLVISDEYLMHYDFVAYLLAKGDLHSVKSFIVDKSPSPGYRGYLLCCAISAMAVDVAYTNDAMMPIVKWLLDNGACIFTRHRILTYSIRPGLVLALSALERVVLQTFFAFSTAEISATIWLREVLWDMLPKGPQDYTVLVPVVDANLAGWRLLKDKRCEIVSIGDFCTYYSLNVHTFHQALTTLILKPSSTGYYCKER